MSVSTVYRLHCDAPSCTAIATVNKITDEPEGWTRISSTDHLADWKPAQRYKSTATGRMRTDPRSSWEINAGSFVRHVCPDHSNVFAEHLPRTEGAGKGRTGDQYVTVTCSCERIRRRVTAATMVWTDAEVATKGPRYIPENAWWHHLPAELQEYSRKGGVS